MMTREVTLGSALADLALSFDAAVEMRPETIIMAIGWLLAFAEAQPGWDTRAIRELWPVCRDVGQPCPEYCDHCKEAAPV